MHVLLVYSFYEEKVETLTKKQNSLFTRVCCLYMLHICHIAQFFFLVDEKPAGVEDTFLLCPAPVIDEIGK